MSSLATVRGGQVVVPSKDVVSRNLGDEAVLVPVGGPADRAGRLFVLNEVGAFIWDTIHTMGAPEAIVQRLVETFEVEEDEARADLGAFIDSLLAAGCINLTETETA